MKKRNRIVACILGTTLSALCVFPLQSLAAGANPAGAKITYDARKDGEHAAVLRISAQVEGRRISAGDLSLELPRMLRVDSKKQAVTEKGELTFDLRITKSARAAAPVTGDAHAPSGAILLLAAALVAAGGGALVFRKKGTGGRFLCLVAAGSLVTLSAVSGYGAQAAEGYAHTEPVAYTITIGGEAYEIKGSLSYDLEQPQTGRITEPTDRTDAGRTTEPTDKTDAETTTEPADRAGAETTTEPADRADAGTTTEQADRADAGTNTEPADRADAGTNTEPTDRADAGTDPIDIKRERGIASLEKLNANPMHRMQVAYDIEKEDPQADITPEELVNVTRLDLTAMDLEDYDFLYLMPRLTELSLGNNIHFDDEAMPVLSDLVHLTKLTLAGTDISDLTPLGDLIHMESLNISETNVRSLAPLAGMKKLKSLTAFELAEEDESPDQAFDFSVLPGFADMEELDVTGIPLSDLSFASGMPRLRRLAIDETGITDLSPLRDKTMLEELRAGGNQVEDVSPLSGLSHLRTLELKNNQIEEIAPLSHLTALETLALEHNRIGDLSGLGALQALTNLTLDDNRIGDVSPLAHLTALENLRLNDNQIADVTPLAHLTALRGLELRGNRITDVSALGQVTHLQSLLLSGNRIKDLSGLQPLWNGADGADRTILAEDESAELTIDRANLDRPVPLLGAGYTYGDLPEGMTVDENGALVAEPDAGTADEVQVTFALAPGQAGDGLHSSYNKKHTGTLRLLFTGERATAPKASLRPMTAEVEEREYDGSYDGDPIYPYNGSTTVKIAVSGEGLTRELLADRSQVSIHVASEGKEEFDTQQWYAQELGGTLYIRIKTGSLEKDPAYSARSPYPRTKFVIRINGYEEKEVYVRYAL